MNLADPIFPPAALTRRQAALLLGIVTAVLVIALPVLTYPLGRDQGEFAVLGRGLLWGRTPYIDLWNPKPPAVFYIYAAFIGLFGRTTEAVRAIDFVLYPLVALLLFDIGRRLAGVTVGLWAALLLGVFYFAETFWTLSQNDGIAMLPMALAAWCALVARNAPLTRRRAFLILGSGLCAGIAFGFKYPFALIGAAVGLWLVLQAWARSRNEALGIGVVFAVGVVASIGAGVAYLAAIGAFDAWLESARVTGAYTALGFEPRTFIGTMAASLQFRWLHWGALLLLVIPGLFAFRRRGLPLLWLGAAAAALLVQAKGYDYHYLPMLPPLALFGAAGAAWLIGRISPLARRLPARAAHGLLASGLLVALGLTIWPRAWTYLTGREDRTVYDARFVAGEYNAGESRRAADYLRARIAAGDSLTIWGFRPEIYYLADLNPATRFLFQFPLVGAWYPASWRQEHVDTLWAAMPPYALVLQADWMPWVTGIDADSNTLLQSYVELNDWLIENYTFETQIDNVLVWRREG